MVSELPVWDQSVVSECLVVTGWLMSVQCVVTGCSLSDPLVVKWLVSAPLGQWVLIGVSNGSLGCWQMVSEW